MAIHKYTSNPPSSPRRRKLMAIAILLFSFTLIFGFWFLIKSIVASHNYTALQGDAVFYDIGNKPAIVSGVKYFKATSVGSKSADGSVVDNTTYGNDVDFVAAYDLQTGQQIWRRELDPQTKDNEAAGGG